MKKSILILSTAIASIGLMAFTFCDMSADSKTIAEKAKIELPVLSFDYGPRHKAIPLKEVHSATSIRDFLSEEEYASIVSLKSVDLIAIYTENQSDTRATGHSADLTKKQKKILQSFDYSSNFTFQIKFSKKNEETGELEDSKLGPYLTIVPEKQAEYVPGKDALVSYVQKNTESRMPLIDGKNLRPIIVYFTIKENGSVSDIIVRNSSGYPSIDDMIIDIMHKMPGKWTPAENGEGQIIEQELALSIYAGGC